MFKIIKYMNFQGVSTAHRTTMYTS